MASIFTRIVNREIPAHIVAESENCLAFLDIFPLVRGHVLVIPKQEVDYLFDLDAGLYQELMMFSRQVAGSIARAIPCKRVGVAVVGLEVPHAHIHLVPLHSIDDLNFSRPKLTLSDEELKSVASGIRQAWENA